jgi:APA family basic amino acid/polyamine antiporter
MVSCLYLMGSLPVETWLRLLAWMAAGLVVYFTYARSHSRLRDRAYGDANP